MGLLYLGGGDITHWLAVWQQMIEEREEQTLRIRRQEGLEERVDYWKQRAPDFAQFSREAADKDTLLQRLLQEITPKTTVLDVGAGTGRYTIPLAKVARKVIAVDSSPDMLSFLKESAQSQGLTNITIVHAPWEAALVEACDIVICSHVTYSVKDIGGFLGKMMDNTRVGCYIAIRITQFDAPIRELWELVHGEPRKPETTFIQLYNLLYEMGVYANAEIVTFGSGQNRMWSYGDWEEALEGCWAQLYIRPDSGRDAFIKDYLKSKLTEREGRLFWPDLDRKAAILWWKQDKG